MTFRQFRFGDIVVLLLMSLCSPCWLSFSQDNLFHREPGWTRAEYMPEFCDYTQDGSADPTEKGAYYSLYGPAFHHTHHYCRALYHLHHAIRDWDDENRRRFRYERAIVDCDYVLERSSSDFFLRPEIFYNKGVALRALDRNIEATQCFREALTLRPGYIPAYVALANTLEAAGDSQEARRILQAALKYAPDNALLRRKLSNLPGSPHPDPE